MKATSANLAYAIDLLLVLERETALATARGSELRAQTNSNKAIAEEFADRE